MSPLHNQLLPRFAGWGDRREPCAVPVSVAVPAPAQSQPTPEQAGAPRFRAEDTAGERQWARLARTPAGRSAAFVAAALRMANLPCTHEPRLRRGVAALLTELGLPVVGTTLDHGAANHAGDHCAPHPGQCEANAQALLVDGVVAVVLCTSGQAPQLRERVARLAGQASVRAVICAGTPRWLWRMEHAALGKPVLAVRLVQRIGAPEPSVPAYDAPLWAPDQARLTDSGRTPDPPP